MSKNFFRVLADLSVGCGMGMGLLIVRTEITSIIAAADLPNAFEASAFYWVLPWPILAVLFWVIGLLWRKFAGQHAKLQAYIAGFVFVGVPAFAYYPEITTMLFLWSFTGGMLCVCSLILAVHYKRNEVRKKQ